MEQDEVEALYQKFYADEFFVRYQRPTLAAVRGTNFCDVAVESEATGSSRSRLSTTWSRRERPGDPEHEPDVRVCGRRRAPQRGMLPP